MTAGTDGSRTDSGPDADFQTTVIWGETEVSIDEAGETIALVEKRDNLHELRQKDLRYNR